MKHNNRLSKVLERETLKEFDPKLIAEIENYLSKLEVVWLKWAKAHPNWKENED